MESKKLGDSSWLYYDTSGVLRSDLMARGLLLHTCRGVLGREFADIVIDDGKACLQQFGRCVFMVDGAEVSRVSTDFREAVTAWLATTEQTETHFLLQSKMLEMAVNVANLVVLRKAPLKAYSNVREWEKIGSREVANFRRMPLTDPERFAGLPLQRSRAKT